MLCGHHNTNFRVNGILHFDVVPENINFLKMEVRGKPQEDREEPKVPKVICNRGIQPNLFLSTSTSKTKMQMGGQGSDFSDHFVVQRHTETVSSPLAPIPPPTPPLLTRSKEFFESSLISDFDLNGNESQCKESPGSEGQTSGEGDKVVKEFKKLLTPFQFGKRQKTTGISLIEGKESNSRHLPGRVQQLTVPLRNSVLRPFTAIDMTPLSPVEELPQSLFLNDSTLTTEESLLESSKSSSTSITPSPPPLKVKSKVNQESQDSIKRHPFGYCLKQSMTTGSGSGQNKGNVGKLQQAQLMNKYKPNVYKNPSTLVSPSYQSQYYSRGQNPAKGDAPNKNDSTGQGHLNNRLRPKTVTEGQVSYSEKLTMINSLVKPAPGTTSMFCQRPFPQSKGQGTTVAQNHQQEGYTHKFVAAKYFRNDLTSPLGNFHAPIRPFVILPLSENFDMSWQQQGDEQQVINSIFHTCQQKLPIPMHLVFDCLVNLRKVGEGVYGEVFFGYFRGLPDQRVYKIVPIEGSKIVNGEKQKRFEEIEPEIIVSQELNKLRQGYNGSYTDGHSKMLFTRICQGRYPAILVDQWKTWHRTYVSQNDVPEFDSSQLYTVFEFSYHGTDIESYKFKNAKQSTAVLLHVIHALAAAEAACEFEHRDLHWGNILVVKTREPFTTYTIQGTTFRVPNCGLKSTIIDYTISRLTTACGTPIFTDLAHDEDQFCGSEDYQFEIYRMMRQENKNDWSTFYPKTNIFWAHYLVEKLINKGRYVDTTSSTHNLFKTKLYRIQNNLLKFSSCQDCAHRFLPSICRDLEMEGS